MSIEPIQIKNQPAKDTPPELCIRSIATNMLVLRRNELSKGNEREREKQKAATISICANCAMEIETFSGMKNETES